MPGYLLPMMIMAASLYKANEDKKKETKETKKSDQDYADEILYSPWLDIEPSRREAFKADPFGTVLQGAGTAAMLYERGKATDAIKETNAGKPGEVPSDMSRYGDIRAQNPDLIKSKGWADEMRIRGLDPRQNLFLKDEMGGIYGNRSIYDDPNLFFSRRFS